MRIGVNVDVTAGAAAAAARLTALEAAGLDEAWVAESYGVDAVSTLGYLAGSTRRVRLGAGILNVFSRSAGLLAMTAVGMDRLAPGRFVLGLGASGPQVVEGLHGIPYERAVERVDEAVDACRRAWRREPVTAGGPAPVPSAGARPMKLLATPGSDVAIHVAGLGPRMVELAAAKADGWLPLFFVPELADAVWGDALRRGRSRRDPTLAPLEIVAGGLLAITDDADEARRLRDGARPMLALYLGGMGPKGRNFYHQLACRYGFEPEADEVQELFLAGRRADAEAAVPAALIEGTTLVGSATEVAARVADYRAAGVTSLCVEPVGADAEHVTIGTFRAIVDEVAR